MKPRWWRTVVYALTMCALLLVGVGVASAEDLSNTQISEASFAAAACGGTLGFMNNPFSFDGGVDGTVASAVFAGCAAGGSSGLFFYVYQINHSATSSEEMIHGISMKWQSLVGFDFAASPPGPETSYWLTGTGVKHPTMSIMNPSTASGTLTFNFVHDPDPGEGDHILRGENSVVFGATSTLPPGTVFANLLNAGQETEAEVFVPVPEPASMLLLTSGLLGLSGLGVVRRRKAKVPLAV